jgi:hypothetical protein
MISGNTQYIIWYVNSVDPIDEKVMVTPEQKQLEIYSALQYEPGQTPDAAYITADPPEPKGKKGDLLAIPFPICLN